MNVYEIYLFDICWMWCMLNGTFVTIKFIDISLWWKIHPQCYEGHGGGKGYAKFVIVASTWWVDTFQTLCIIHFYTWWKKSFLELLTPTRYAYTFKKTCEKWKTNWIKKPWHACDGPTDPSCLCEVFDDASYPKACHPCPKGREDFSKAL
jgi:hypothetical protein